MKTKVYTTGQILAVIATLALGTFWALSRSLWDGSNENILLILTITVGVFTVGILCFRNLVYNKNGYELLEEFPVYDQVISTFGALLVFSASISLAVMGFLSIITPLYMIVVGVFE